VVDPDRVRRLLQALRAYRDALAVREAMHIDDYVVAEAFAGRYLVQAAAQACIDIANHMVASEGWRVPADFRDAFTVLEEQQVIDGKLADRLRALAGLRNRLVHLYDDIDDRKVYAALPEGLADFDAFARSVARLLNDDASTA
jgi:uncharacterized protein YutE (UPF0331/DUF86 family)